MGIKSISYHKSFLFQWTFIGQHVFSVVLLTNTTMQSISQCFLLKSFHDESIEPWFIYLPYIEPWFIYLPYIEPWFIYQPMIMK